jgi:hypothetical protein
MKKVLIVSIMSLLLTSAAQISIKRDYIIGTWRIHEAKNNSGSIADSSMFMYQSITYLNNGLGIFYHPNSPISTADTGYWEVSNNTLFLMDSDSSRQKQNVLELTPTKMVILHEHDDGKSTTTITYIKQKKG